MMSAEPGAATPTLPTPAAGAARSSAASPPRSVARGRHRPRPCRSHRARLRPHSRSGSRQRAGFERRRPRGRAAAGRRASCSSSRSSLAGSQRTDRVIKHGEYADAGIPHYWLVDLDAGRRTHRVPPRRGVRLRRRGTGERDVHRRRALPRAAGPRPARLNPRACAGRRRRPTRHPGIDPIPASSDRRPLQCVAVGVRRAVLGVLLALLAGCSTSGQASPADPPTAASAAPTAVPLPPRPRDVPIDDVDPCTLLTREQRAELQLDRPPQPRREPSLLYPGDVSCVLDQGNTNPRSRSASALVDDRGNRVLDVGSGRRRPSAPRDRRIPGTGGEVPDLGRRVQGASGRRARATAGCPDEIRRGGSAGPGGPALP